MERHKCKLCFKKFANGRALGGHMRAHMINLYATKNDEFYSNSKRVRKSRIFYSDKSSNNEHSSPLSSSSEIITPDKDVAYCLMMMSRDKWGKGNDNFGAAKVSESKVKGKYRCETCVRSFRSYQALGGHMASHKKIKVNAPPLDDGPAVATVVEEKIHKCSFCQRIFASGQALGGHKRSHIAASIIPANVTAITIKQSSRKCDNLDIDLNLPAPIDDADISY